MRKNNRVISICLIALLFILMNEKTYSQSVHINKTITSISKVISSLEKKEKEEKTEEKRPSSNTRIKYIKEKLVVYKIYISYDKILGNNNLKYLE